MTATDYWSIRRQYERCRGLQICQRMESLNRSYYVFRANHDQLHGLLLEAQRPEVWLTISGPGNRSESVKFVDEVCRLLHNFVVAAKTLEDHGRVIVNELYSKHSFHAEFQGKVNSDFANDPLAMFVRELRHYALHCELPLVSTTLSSSLEFRVRLELEKCKAWNGWTSTARRFLMSSNEPPCLATLAGSYRARVEELYSWLDSKQQDAFPDEFAEMQSLYNRVVGMERQ